MEKTTIDEGIKTLVIRPITKLKFSGVSSYSKTKTVFTTQLDANTGLYKNGLTAAEEATFETELNLPKGTLNKKSPYWGELEIILNNDKATFFTLMGPQDEIKERVIKAHSRIANSEFELSKLPGALFYIDDPEEKAKLESTVIEYKLSAIEKFQEATIEEKRSALRVFGKLGIDNMSETMVKAELFKEVEKNPKTFLETLRDPHMKERALLSEALEKKILVKKGHTFYNGEDPIGSSTDAAIEYLSDLKYQQVKLSIMERVKKARK